MALTAMTSSVLAPASSAAQAQGSQLAMGNVSAGNASLNNASLNNVSGNKTDTSSSWADPNTHKVELAQGTAAFDRSAGQMTAMNVRKSDLGVSSGMQDTHTTQDANNFGTSSVATNASSLATNSGVQSVSGSGVTNSVNRDDGWSVNRNTGTTYGTNETASSGTTNSSGIGTNFGRSGNSQENFTYASGFGVGTTRSNNLEHHLPSDAQKNPTTSGEGASQLTITPNSIPFGMNNNIGLPLNFAKGNGNKSSPINQTNNNGHPDTSNMLQSDLFRVNAGPTGSTSSSITDSSALTSSGSKQTVQQENFGISVTEQTSEVTAVTNGTRNSLVDSSNAQRIDQKGFNEGRTASQSSSDQDSATHTTSMGTSNQVMLERDNMVRDLGLEMAGGDAFEALRMFSSNSERRAALKNLIDQQQPTLEKVLPPSGKSVANKGKDFVGTIRDEIEKDYHASAAAVQATSDDSVRRRHEEKSIEPPTKSDFMARTRKERDLANYKLGLQMISTSEYLRDETGIKSVLNIAFGSGVTYSSPQETFQRINEYAQTNEDIRSLITEMGRNAEPGMSDKDIVSRLHSQR